MSLRLDNDCAEIIVLDDSDEEEDEDDCVIVEQLPPTTPHTTAAAVSATSRSSVTGQWGSLSKQMRASCPPLGFDSHRRQSCSGQRFRCDSTAVTNTSASHSFINAGGRLDATESDARGKKRSKAGRSSSNHISAGGTCVTLTSANHSLIDDRAQAGDDDVVGKDAVGDEAQLPPLPEVVVDKQKNPDLPPKDPMYNPDGTLTKDYRKKNKQKSMRIPRLSEFHSVDNTTKEGMSTQPVDNALKVVPLSIASPPKQVAPPIPPRVFDPLVDGYDSSDDEMDLFVHRMKKKQRRSEEAAKLAPLLVEIHEDQDSSQHPVSADPVELPEGDGDCCHLSPVELADPSHFPSASSVATSKTTASAKTVKTSNAKGSLLAKMKIGGDSESSSAASGLTCPLEDDFWGDTGSTDESDLERKWDTPACDSEDSSVSSPLYNGFSLQDDVGSTSVDEDACSANAPPKASKSKFLVARCANENSYESNNSKSVPASNAEPAKNSCNPSQMPTLLSVSGPVDTATASHRLPQAAICPGQPTSRSTLSTMAISKSSSKLQAALRARTQAPATRPVPEEAGGVACIPVPKAAPRAVTLHELQPPSPKKAPAGNSGAKSQQDSAQHLPTAPKAVSATNACSLTSPPKAARTQPLPATAHPSVRFDTPKKHSFAASPQVSHRTQPSASKLAAARNGSPLAPLSGTAGARRLAAAAPPARGSISSISAPLAGTHLTSSTAHKSLAANGASLAQSSGGGCGFWQRKGPKPPPVCQQRIERTVAPIVGRSQRVMGIERTDPLLPAQRRPSIGFGPAPASKITFPAASQKKKITKHPIFRDRKKG
jgi:hypothetical protein